LKKEAKTFASSSAELGGGFFALHFGQGGLQTVALAG
jgi:hypothetical protein